MRRPLGGVRLPKKPRHSRNVRETERGMALHFAGDPEGALAHYTRVLRKDLNAPLPLYFASLAKHQLGHDPASAIPYMLKCLQLAPGFADGWFNLGKLYFYCGREDEAYLAYMAALEHRADHTESLVGVGDHLWEHGRRDEAAQYWTAAVATTPRCPEAAHYRSFIRLRCGDPDGWSDYEARWACKMFVHQYGRPEYAGIPLWVDQEVAGKRIIVHGEQGHGDVIQCARYLPLLRERGATVILEAHKPLVRLLQRSCPWLTVFERGTTYPDLVDYQLPSMSLPHRFGGVAVNAPYLTGRPDGAVTASTDRPRRVALCWRGSKTHVNDRNRSCPVEHLAPLWSVPNVEWVSLQIGDAAEEATGTPMLRVDSRISDFADSADLIASCDLVLSVDTAVAHLAGALGAQTWLMTPVLSEWRWGIDDPTTDLYPSMRIFRQQTKGDWPSVIAQVRGELQKLSA